MLNILDGTGISYVKGDDVEFVMWIDERDRQHFSGMYDKESYGTYVSKPGYRLHIIDGRVEASKKVSVVI